MVELNLTKFAIVSLVIVVFIFGMISSFVLLANNEGRGEIFDAYPEIQSYNLKLGNSIVENESLITTSNINLNISSEYNPEISQSGGDKSGNAVGINLNNIITIAWTSLGFLGYLLFGNIYMGVLSSLIMTIVGFVTASLLIKAIRSGDT